MKILVAVDGSKSALHAVSYAIGLLRQLAPTASSISLLSVHDDVGLRHAKGFVGNQVVADYLRERSEKELKPARKLVDAAGLPCEVVQRTGHVAQEIVEFARKGRFDLIVLGAKGRGALADMLLGSVAQRVLAMAKAPVVLVK